jgi:hypothetical protein
MRAALRMLAVVVAIVASLGETLRSWGAGRPIYAVLDDFLVAALLVAGAWRATRKEGPVLLVAGFAFATGIFYGSFFGHLQALSRSEADPGNIPQACLTSAIGALFVAMIAGFVLSLREALRASR